MVLHPFFQSAQLRRNAADLVLDILALLVFHIQAATVEHVRIRGPNMPLTPNVKTSNWTGLGKVSNLDALFLPPTYYEDRTPPSSKKHMAGDTGLGAQTEQYKI